MVTSAPPNPALYQLATAAALAADGDQDAARRVLALTPDEVMRTLAGDAAETFAEWAQYAGPEGGRGWKNTATGEVRYQDAKPDDDADEPETPLRDTLGNAGRVVLGATAGAGVGSFLGGPPGAIVGMTLGAAAGSDIVSGLIDDARKFFAGRGATDPQEVSARAMAGDPDATASIRENTQRQMRHAAAELANLPPPDPAAVTAAWDEASSKMRAGDAKALGQRVTELVSAGRDPDKVDTAVGNMVGFLGSLTGTAARLAFGAIKAFGRILGRLASTPAGIWAGSLVVGAAVMAAPVAAMVTGIISPATFFVISPLVAGATVNTPRIARGLQAKQVREGTATFADMPRPSGGVLGKGSAPGEPGHPEHFAEKPPVTGMPGPDGKRAEQLLATSREHGIATLAELAERGVRRLLHQPRPDTAATLFDDDELERLAGTLYGAIAAGDLLGRSRVRRRAELAERNTFAEDDDPWHDFTDPIPAVEPEEAVRYFRNLVPSLADDPVRYGPALRREAFTLAVATERTLLDRVKAAIARGLVTGEDQTADIQAVLDDAGVTPRNPQYCFLPGTRVEGAVLAASKARYDGPAVKIETGDGRVLAVTVNHPVLTPGGWKRAGDVQEGDDLLCYGQPVEPLDARGAVRDGRQLAEPATGDPGFAVGPQAGAGLPPKRRAVHDQKVPARIEDVFETVLMERSAGQYVQRPTSPLDFHGDAALFQGDIHCVRADGVLMLRGAEAACPQGFEQIVLVEGHILTTDAARHCGRLLPLRGFGADNPELVARELAQNPLPGVGRHLRPPETMRVGRAADLDPGLFQATEKRPAGDVQLVGKLLQAFPGVVTTNRVVKVERIRWTGHVYDLQTATGFIVSEGVFTSNCEMVWRTNVMDALNAGAMAEMQTPEMSVMFPGWRYDGIIDERTGDDHRPHIGRYFPVSRGFAEVRGNRSFNCRCSPTPVHRAEWAELVRAGKAGR